MNCEQYQEYISQFIDGELLAAVETELFMHLGSCEHCRSFLKETMSLRSKLLINKTVVVPESLNRRIVADTASTRPENKMQLRHYKWIPQKRTFSLRTVGLALILSIILSISFTSLWYRSNIASPETVVYVPTLPTEEVRGYVATTSNLPH